MYKQLVDSISEIGNFSEFEQSQFVDRIQALSLQKGDYLLRKGQTCAALYYLKKGSLRHYHQGEDDYNNILNLFTEKDWVLDHQSFTLQKPSKNDIQANEQSEVFMLGLADLHELIAISPTYFQLGTILESGMQNPFKQNQRLTPEERYLMLLDERPQVVQRFPLKFIASYLGITPETLSRVRRKISG